jgi:hypothetical protein
MVVLLPPNGVHDAPMRGANDFLDGLAKRSVPA